jgi:hypothetical protein
LATRSAQAAICQPRINAVLSYVRDPLDEALPLGPLARAAGFSPFHFRRLSAAAPPLPAG